MNNLNPEQFARDKINKILIDEGWLVQSKNKVELSANMDLAIRDYQTVRLTQGQMGQLFGKAKSNINEHIKNIYAEGELE